MILKYKIIIIKLRPLLAECFPIVYDIEINSAIANNIKPIIMMELLCVTVNPNIYGGVFGDIKIHHDHPRNFADTTNKA